MRDAERLEDGLGRVYEENGAGMEGWRRCFGSADEDGEARGGAGRGGGAAGVSKMEKSAVARGLE